MSFKKELICVHHVPGYMMIDITNELAKDYDKVYLLAGEVRKRRKDLDSNIEFVKIIKYNPKNNITRIITWLVSFIQIFFFILFKSRKADLFLTTNPPLTIFLPLIFKNKFKLLVYDIYPDVLFEYNLVKKDSILVKWWQKINKRVYEKAYRLYTIGDGMKSKMEKYVSKKEIEIVPCWTDSEFLKPVSKTNNTFIKENGLEGKFLVIYSGNLGFTHDIEILVFLAEMSTRDNLHFLIIGEGDKKKLISDLIREKQLKNINLLPWQPIEMLPYSLSAADIAVVTLGKGASLMSVPSKLYDTMGVGSPLLIISEEISEMAKIVKKYNIGESYENEQLKEMLTYIYSLMDDNTKHQTLRNNALKASRDFTSKNACLFK